MPYRITRYQPTPNPHAMKCFLDAPLSTVPRSFRTKAEGQSDPVASGIFAVPGITGLLINGDWLTVNKSADAAWPALQAGLERALAALPASAHPAPDTH